MGRLRLGTCAAALAALAAVAAADVSGNEADETDKPWLGIVMSPGSRGVKITEVIPLSPAAVAGIEAGDQLFELDGQNVESPRHLKTIVESHAVGDEISLRVWRNGAKRTLHTALGRMLTSTEMFHQRLVNQPPPSLDVVVAHGDADPELGRYEGDLVLIAFWGTSADIASAAWLERMTAEHGANGLVVIAVSRASEASLARWAQRKKLSFTVMSDPNNVANNGATHERYQIGSKDWQVRPTVYVLIDRDGKVVYGGDNAKSGCKTAVEAALQERNGLSVE